MVGAELEDEDHRLPSLAAVIEEQINGLIPSTGLVSTTPRIGAAGTSGT